MRLFNNVRVPWSRREPKSRPAPVYSYKVMYQMPISGIFDAMVVENVVRYLNERLGLPLRLIKPTGVRKMADEANAYFYQPRVMET